MRNKIKNTALFLACSLVLGVQAVSAFGTVTETVKPMPGVPVSADAATRTLPDDVLAKVNDSPITRAEVDRVIRIFIAESRVSHDISPEARTQAEEAALEQLIATRLLYHAGLKLEIKDLDRQIAGKIDKEKTKFPTPAAYDAALKTNNFTEQDAQHIVRNDIVVTNLVTKEIINKIVVSDADAKTFYNQNMEKFTKQENIRLHHILSGIEQQATAEEKQKSKEQAEAIRTRILAGANFTAVAKAESSCPSKEEGGDLGNFEKGDLIPEFEKATELLKIGEISNVVETKDGYHILKLVEKNPTIVQTFDEAKEKIQRFLKQMKTQQAIQDYVADLRKMAKIEMYAPGSSGPSYR